MRSPWVSTALDEHVRLLEHLHVHDLEWLITGVFKAELLATALGEQPRGQATACGPGGPSAVLLGLGGLSGSYFAEVTRHIGLYAPYCFTGPTSVAFSSRAALTTPDCHDEGTDRHEC